MAPSLNKSLLQAFILVAFIADLLLSVPILSGQNPWSGGQTPVLVIAPSPSSRHASARSQHPEHLTSPEVKASEEGSRADHVTNSEASRTKSLSQENAEYRVLGKVTHRPDHARQDEEFKLSLLNTLRNLSTSGGHDLSAKQALLKQEEVSDTLHTSKDTFLKIEHAVNKTGRLFRIKRDLLAPTGLNSLYANAHVSSRYDHQDNTEARILKKVGQTLKHPIVHHTFNSGNFPDTDLEKFYTQAQLRERLLEAEERLSAAYNILSEALPQENGVQPKPTSRDYVDQASVEILDAVAASAAAAVVASSARPNLMSDNLATPWTPVDKLSDLRKRLVMSRSPRPEALMSIVNALTWKARPRIDVQKEGYFSRAATFHSFPYVSKFDKANERSGVLSKRGRVARPDGHTMVHFFWPHSWLLARHKPSAKVGRVKKVERQPSIEKRFRAHCDIRRLTPQMLEEYFTSGKLCGVYILRFRFGIGK